MRYFLFTTTTCQKCPELKAFVEENVSFDGVILDENDFDFGVKMAEFGVATAPTFIVVDGDLELFWGSEIYEIQEFLSNLS